MKKLTALTSFYWRDTLPVEAVRLAKITTGTYNAADGLKIKCSSIHTPLFVRWTQGGVNFWTRRNRH